MSKVVLVGGVSQRTEEANCLLRQMNGLDVATFVFGDRIFERIARSRPDLVIIDDTASAGVEGFSLLDRIVSELPSANVLVITVVLRGNDSVREIRGRSGLDVSGRGRGYIAEDCLANMLEQSVRICLYGM